MYDVEEIRLKKIHGDVVSHMTEVSIFCVLQFVLVFLKSS